MRVQDIPLKDVMETYLPHRRFIQDGATRLKTTCPFHNDTSPSLVLYDKVEQGIGWDYHCFSCAAHGNAVSMLAGLKMTPSEEHAEAMLRRDFGLELPDKLTLKDFCEYKGLDLKFVQDSAGWREQPNGIVMPYYDAGHVVIHNKIRVKYQGKDKYVYEKQTGNPLNHMAPYGLHWLDAYDDTALYITEGETDCITMRQAGFQVLGFPSTNGFKPEFAMFLRRFASIIVVRDNDEAGWTLLTDLAEQFPENLYMVVLPRGIKDVNNFHINRCQSKIERFTTLFSALPVLPGAPEVFLKAVVNKEMPPTERECWEMVYRIHTTETEQIYFRERMKEEAKVSMTLLKAAAKGSGALKKASRDNGEFNIINNCYYKTTMMGDRAVETKVSNFILVPEYDIYAGTEIVRVVTLTNELGEEVHGVRLDAEAMTSNARFNQAIIRCGNFIFTGSQDDLFRLATMIFERNKKVVHTPSTIGRLPGGGWLFGNCGIDARGHVHIVKGGTVTLDDKTYAPKSSIVDDAGNASDLPTFKVGAYKDAAGKKFLRATARSLRQTFGTYGAYLALGWCVAGWFSDAIFEQYGFYPHLFISGKRSSGKSVLSTMLQGTFGFDASGAGMSIETPTNVGIIRHLASRASLPCWYDDYRIGVPRIRMKEGLLLDVYNRHGAVKGSKRPGEIVSEDIKGFALLSGEDVPENNALLTRCVIVQLAVSERDASQFDRATSYMELFRARSLQLAKLSARGHRNEKLFATIDEVTQRIFDKNGDIRYARNYGIFAGAFLFFFGDVITDKKDFMEFLTSNAYTARLEIDSAHPMAEFFNDFPNMIARGLIIRDRDFVLVDTDKVAIRLRECHKAWSDYTKGAKLAERTLRDYVKKEPFFHSEERVYFDGAGRFRAAVCRLDVMEREFEDFCEAVSLQDKPTF